MLLSWCNLSDEGSVSGCTLSHRDVYMPRLALCNINITFTQYDRWKELVYINFNYDYTDVKYKITVLGGGGGGRVEDFLHERTKILRQKTVISKWHLLRKLQSGTCSDTSRVL